MTVDFVIVYNATPTSSSPSVERDWRHERFIKFQGWLTLGEPNIQCAEEWRRRNFPHGSRERKLHPLLSRADPVEDPDECRHD